MGGQELNLRSERFCGGGLGCKPILHTQHEGEFLGELQEINLEHKNDPDHLTLFVINDSVNLKYPTHDERLQHTRAVCEQ